MIYRFKDELGAANNPFSSDSADFSFEDSLDEDTDEVIIFRPRKYSTMNHRRWWKPYENFQYETNKMNLKLNLEIAVEFGR